MSVNPSADMDSFRKLLLKVNAVVILTGAGVSAESGVPTFRGAGGLWRIYSATDLATPSAFRSNPSLVWEFYHHRRENVASKHPNNVLTWQPQNLFLCLCNTFTIRHIKQ